MHAWSIKRLPFDLKYSWTISRGTSIKKENVLVSFENEGKVGLGECAPNIRYGESVELVLQHFDRIHGALKNELSIHEFATFIDRVAIPSCLKNGLIQARINWEYNGSLSAIMNGLSVPVVREQETFFTIPILPQGELVKFVELYDLTRFGQVKVKVDKENATRMVKETLEVFGGPVAVDGNECWKDPVDVLNFIEAVGEDNLTFIEQPLPAGSLVRAAYLKERSPVELIADESVRSQVERKDILSCYNGVNLKLNKTGGLIKGLELLNEARKLDLKVMVGCMVETSLGISHGLVLGALADYRDLDSFMYVKNEPFKLIEENKGRISF